MNMDRKTEFPNAVYAEENGCKEVGSRSSSSSSGQASSKRFMDRHIKSPRRLKLILLALVVAITVVIVVVVALAVHFSDGNGKTVSEVHAVIGDDIQDIIQDTTSKVTKANVPTPTHHTTKQIPHTLSTQRTLTYITSPTKKTKPDTKTFLPKKSTEKPSLTLTPILNTTTRKLRTTDITTKSTMIISTLFGKTINETVVPTRTSLSETSSSSSPSSLASITSSPKQQPTTSNPILLTTEHLVGTHISTSAPRIKPEVHFEDVILFFNTTTAELSCTVLNLGMWNNLSIQRVDGDIYETMAVAIPNGDDVTVRVLHPDVTYRVNRSGNELTLNLTFEKMYCDEVSNYTCVLDFAEGVIKMDANVTVQGNLPSDLAATWRVHVDPPVMFVPHVIIEGREITLKCSTEIIGENGDIQWGFKSSGSAEFNNLPVEPITEKFVGNCTTIINSTLTFHPTKYENGSHFRCDIMGTDYPSYVNQQHHVDVEIHVVPKNFCDDKAPKTVHKHPFYPCSLAVFCSTNNPLVYKIACEEGYCYDPKTTRCVPNNVQDTTTSVDVPRR